MRRVGGDSQDSREHFDSNATSVQLSLHFLLLPLVTVVVAGNAVGGVQCRSDGASVVSVTSGKVGRRRGSY